MADWKIEKKGGGCSTCEKEFADGERLVSALVFQGEGLAREDHCPKCWTGSHLEGEEAPESELFWWFTRHVLGKKRSLQLDLASLEALFVSLEGREEIHVREVRYVLCLILMRKRRLKVEKIERGEEGESFIVKRPRRDERYQVFVFDFTAEQLNAVRGRMQALFDGMSEEGDQELSIDEPETSELAPAELPVDADSDPDSDPEEDPENGVGALAVESAD